MPGDRGVFRERASRLRPAVGGTHPLVDLPQQQAQAAEEPDAPRAARGGGRGLLPHAQRMRPQADHHAPARGAGREHRDKTVLRMMREMGIRCAIRRERPCRRYSSYRGAGGQTFGNMLRRDFSAEAPGRRWAPTSPSSASRGQGVLRAGLRPLHQGDSRLVDLREPEHGPAGRAARRAGREDAQGRKAHPPQRHGLAAPARRLVREAQARGHHPEHVEKGKLPEQRLYRGPVRPSQGRVLEGQRMAGLRVVQGRPRLVRPALERKEESGSPGQLHARGIQGVFRSSCLIAIIDSKKWDAGTVHPPNKQSLACC